VNHPNAGAAAMDVSSSPGARLRAVSRLLVTVAVVATMLVGTIAFTVTPAAAEQGFRNGAPPEGQVGDLPAPAGTVSYRDLVATGDVSTATTTDALNLRSGPSLEAAIQQVIPAGSTVEVTGAVENGFYPVTFREVAGFAHGDYLAIGDSEETDSATTDEGTGTSGGNSGGSIVQIIYNAAAMYGQNGDDMLRVATCESGLNPSAVNGSSNASGLFQFMPSTWATTPYAGEDIFNPVANAEAAAWMWANGRRGEWSCQ
jgi:hypothetical protein